MRLVLASKSQARQTVLRNAGLEFEIYPAAVDERAIQSGLKAQGATPGALAVALAAAKAQSVSADMPGRVVIGADQLLVCENEIFSKAESPQEAQQNLKTLRGRTHTLYSAVCLYRDGDLLWSFCGEAHLKMHNFDDAFLDLYCARAGDALTQCVGGYEIEALGAQLFESVQGDYFTILGLPLLPLLAALRERFGTSLREYFYERFYTHRRYRSSDRAQ